MSARVVLEAVLWLVLWLMAGVLVAHLVRALRRRRGQPLPREWPTVVGAILATWPLWLVMVVLGMFVGAVQAVSRIEGGDDA